MEEPKENLEEDQNEEENDKSRYLEFVISGTAFAVPLTHVKEVMPLGTTTRIPNGDKHFQGVMNLRGRIVTIMDLSRKLRLHDRSEGELNDPAVIISQVGHITIGLIVEEIRTVKMIGKSEILDIPEVKAQMPADYVLGVCHGPDGLIIILNLFHILGVNELEDLAS